MGDIDDFLPGKISVLKYTAIIKTSSAQKLGACGNEPLFFVVVFFCCFVFFFVVVFLLLLFFLFFFVCFFLFFCFVFLFYRQRGVQ